MMNQSEVEAFIQNLDNVQQSDNFGYLFYFVGDDHRLPFATIGYADNDFDQVSQLHREGVFRVNIGVSKASFQSLFEGSAFENSPDDIDYSVLDVFLPHPHYAKQHFVCILNPSKENAEITKQLIVEAHSIATDRLQRKQKKS